MNEMSSDQTTIQSSSPSENSSALVMPRTTQIPSSSSSSSSSTSSVISASCSSISSVSAAVAVPSASSSCPPGAAWRLTMRSYRSEIPLRAAATRSVSSSSLSLACQLLPPTRWASTADVEAPL
uniref:Predicted protein n=1 Tax=Hordeum vulgare subsp. vulgare TaxID=112509 RepID=F2CYB0_HORVV|nr:predicted protein [Hordeum vulgare subsp. vulgare]